MTRTFVIAASLVLFSAPTARAQAPGAAPPPPETKVDASTGGVTISSGVNSLTIGARAQVRWTLDDRDMATADQVGLGVGREDGLLSQFDIPRMRVTLSGGMLRPWLRYAFQFDFSRTGGEGASKIKDAILEIRPPGRSYRLLAGQFKVPFGMQQLTSSGRLQFVDRAITDAKFNPAREMGVMLTGTLAARTIGYDIGLFNGSGESVRQNTASHLWAGRLYFDPLGPYALSEGSSDAGARPVLHVGVGARGGKAIRGRTPVGVIQDADNETAVDLEFAFKSPRFYSTAEHFWMTAEQRNPFRGPDIVSRGYHAQAGFMLIPRTNEVAVLTSRIVSDTRVPDAAVTEIRGMFGHYFNAHALKVHADLGVIDYESGVALLSARARLGLPPLGTRLGPVGRYTDRQARVQMQLTF